MVAAAKEGTKFVTRKFLTATRPLIPHHLVPQAQPLKIQVPGNEVDLGEVLHDEIVIRPLVSTTNQYLNGAATGSDSYGGINGQIYPATNVTGRVPYFLFDGYVKTPEGLYDRTQVEVQPPPFQE